ncbi:MAG: family transposase [Frankiales bacterium]|nr:family transposase [Frankiales bacterium]
MSHANARLNEFGRNLAVERYLAGQSAKDVAGQLGVSRQTVHKWVNRWRLEGPAGLADRSSRPHHSPQQVPLEVELQVLAARLQLHAGPVQLAAELDLPASTIGQVLRRWQMPLLRDLDRITGELLRHRVTDERYEHPRPGDLLHVDVKKLGRIPPGGGWRLNGERAINHHNDHREPVGYDCIHVAVDDYSRVVYAEVLPDEKAATCAAFLHRAIRWFREQHGVVVRRVLTDNALSYRRSNAWAAVCTALQVKRRFIKPFCPWTNGKAERFNRTLLTDWAYARPWTSNAQRTAAFDGFLDRYNTRRAHTALGGQPPISRLAA